MMQDAGNEKAIEEALPYVACHLCRPGIINNECNDLFCTNPKSRRIFAERICVLYDAGIYSSILQAISVHISVKHIVVYFWCDRS